MLHLLPCGSRIKGRYTNQLVIDKNLENPTRNLCSPSRIWKFVKAMDLVNFMDMPDTGKEILEKHYPNELVYDNATTHLKHR